MGEEATTSNVPLKNFGEVGIVEGPFLCDSAPLRWRILPGEDLTQRRQDATLWIAIDQCWR
jgi:hypothetical protein